MKSVFGLSENLAAALAYAGFFVTGIIVLIFEKENKSVRFCALQSTVLFLVLSAAISLLSIFPLIGGLLSGLVSLGMTLSWIYLTASSFMGQRFRVPVLGDIAWEQANK